MQGVVPGRGAKRPSAAALCAATLAAVALSAAGCGKAAEPSPAQVALEREDLVLVARALENVQGQTEVEVAATRTAWPLVARGLAPGVRGIYTPPLQRAIEAGERLVLPQLFDESQAAILTGPASGLAGLYRTFAGLGRRGWQMIGAAVYEIEHGSPSAARFARANVALYIESIYDAHFSLGQVGKQLAPAYAKLGGEAVFGAALTQDEVNDLVGVYSVARNRLQPHETVGLGS